MPVYLIPSKKDIENYLNDYETEGISKGLLLSWVCGILDDFREYPDYPVIDIGIFFAYSFTNSDNIEYKTIKRNIIPFVVLNNICRVYYVDFGDEKPHYEFFPISQTNQDRELLWVLENFPNPDYPDRSIDKEMFESSYTRLDKNGNYVPVKV